MAQPTALLPAPASTPPSNATWLMPMVRFWSLLCVAAMMAASYRLWLPPGWSTFPQVPAIKQLINASAWWDYAALTGLLLSIFVALKNANPFKSIQLFTAHTKGGSRSPGANGSAKVDTPFMAILAFGVLLVLLNQHRLQAWFYQILIYSLVFLLHSQQLQFQWLRRIVLSIYLFSSIGKLDYEFAHTTGQELLQAVFMSVGIDLADWSMVDRIGLALCLPLSELLLALGLGWHCWSSNEVGPSSRWRRLLRIAPGILTTFFHLLLSYLLLWKLQHSWGVVLWNVQFAGQAILLFVLPEFCDSQTGIRSRPVNSDLPIPRSRRGVVLMLLGTLLLPIVERWGYWDHWPSWALYAPHSSRVIVSIAPFAVKQLPADLREIYSQASNGDDDVPIPISQWSLNSLGVPIYPQSRFQLGVAQYLARSLQSQYSIRGVLLSAADRFTGERQSEVLQNADQLQRSSKSFWLNSQPRN